MWTVSTVWMNLQSKLINEYLFDYLVSLSLGGSQLLGCDWLKPGGHQKPPEIMSCWWHESPAVGNQVIMTDQSLTPKTCLQIPPLSAWIRLDDIWDTEHNAFCPECSRSGSGQETSSAFLGGPSIDPSAQRTRPGFIFRDWERLCFHSIRVKV